MKEKEKKKKTHMNIHLYEDLKIYRILLKLVTLNYFKKREGGFY